MGGRAIPAVEQLVTFCILMQGNGGILTKHPDYLLEKFMMATCFEEPQALLDPRNLKTFYEYAERWGLSREGRQVKKSIRALEEG